MNNEHGGNIDKLAKQANYSTEAKINCSNLLQRSAVLSLH